MKYYLVFCYIELSWSLQCFRCPVGPNYILQEPFPACFVNDSDTGYLQNCAPWLTKCATEFIRKSSSALYFSIVQLRKNDVTESRTDLLPSLMVFK